MAECPVGLCCFHRPTFPVTRVVDGNAFNAGIVTDGEELPDPAWTRDGQHRDLPVLPERGSTRGWKWVLAVSVQPALESLER